MTLAASAECALLDAQIGGAEVEAVACDVADELSQLGVHDEASDRYLAGAVVGADGEVMIVTGCAVPDDEPCRAADAFGQRVEGRSVQLGVDSAVALGVIDRDEDDIAGRCRGSGGGGLRGRIGDGEVAVREPGFGHADEYEVL